MISIKLSFTFTGHLFVLELQPFNWKLHSQTHAAGFGAILGPFGVGYINAFKQVQLLKDKLKHELSGTSRDTKRTKPTWGRPS